MVTIRSSSPRSYTYLDRLLITLNQSIETLFLKTTASTRTNPAKDLPEAELSAKERQLTGSLMRINHVGEICAQALYQGQAITARNPTIQYKLTQAAHEENDHLAWCQQRLNEVNAHPSYLNPLWYIGSFVIGATAGLCGDQWSLGFLAETERQVAKHLDNHLQKLPIDDAKSRQILLQMHMDETQHATTAIEAGAALLPEPIKIAMQWTSKVMTSVAYWI